MSEGTRVGVGVVVRTADGRVLTAARAAEPGAPLAVPGGKLESGETIEQCAARELTEETGIALGPDAFGVFGSALSTDHAGQRWLVAGVETQLDREADQIELREREPDKVRGFRWIDPADPPDGLYPATAELLRQLERA